MVETVAEVWNLAKSNPFAASMIAVIVVASVLAAVDRFGGQEV